MSLHYSHSTFVGIDGGVVDEIGGEVGEPLHTVIGQLGLIAVEATQHLDIDHARAHPVGDLDATKARRWTEQHDDGFVDGETQVVDLCEGEATTMRQVGSPHTGDAPILGAAGNAERDVGGSHLGCDCHPQRMPRPRPPVGAMEVRR